MNSENSAESCAAAEVCYDDANNEDAMWMPIRQVRHAPIIEF